MMLRSVGLKTLYDQRRVPLCPRFGFSPLWGLFAAVSWGVCAAPSGLAFLHTYAPTPSSVFSPPRGVLSPPLRWFV